MEDNNSKKPEEMQVLETLQKIKNGLLNPNTLSKEARQLCVEALALEGYHVSPIAGLMKRSDRTIRRDLEDIRKRNALRASPELSRMLTGELLVNARNQYSRLKQLARLPEASPEEKARTEFLAWRVYKELIDMLYFVGFIVKDESKEPLSPSLEAIKKEAKVSEKQKKIDEMMKPLSLMEKHMLIDKLYKYMTSWDEDTKEDGEADGAAAK